MYSGMLSSFKKDLPSSSAGKESTCNAGDLGLTPGLGRSPGEGKGYPLQYSGLENSMDCIIYGVTKSWTHALKRKEILICTTIWMKLEDIVLNKPLTKI